jgi:S-DNA-T family DNA segregation ATPase FtsK/SpoIIIE
MMRQSLLRSGALIGAGVVGLFALFYAVSILSYSPADNAFNSAAEGASDNWMGQSGAYLADASLFTFGLPAILLFPLLLVYARRLWRDVPQPRWKRQLLLCLLGILILGFGLAHWQHGSDIGLPAGWGGTPALLLDGAFSALAAKLGDGWGDLARWVAIIVSVVGGVMLVTRSLELERPLFTIPSIPMPSIGSSTERVATDPSAPQREPEFVADPVPRKPVEREPRRAPEIAERQVALCDRGQTGRFLWQLHAAFARSARYPAAFNRAKTRQGGARIERPPARIGARRFQSAGRNRRSAPRPGRHHV